MFQIHEETKECQKQVDTLKNMEHNEKIISAIFEHLKCDIQIIAAIIMIIEYEKLITSRAQSKAEENVEKRKIRYIPLLVISSKVIAN